MDEFTLDPAPSAPAWFAEHSLMTNITVRNYLKQYSQHAWPEITKLTLICGIIALQHNYKGETLSLQQLKHAVQSSATTVVVQSNVPHLQRQILHLQSQLDNVFDKLAVEPLQVPQAPEKVYAFSSEQLQAKSPPRQSHVQPSSLLQQRRCQQPAPRLQQQPQQEQIPPEAVAASQQSGLGALRARQGRTCRHPITAPKPSDAWRQGVPSGYTSPPRVNRRSQDNQGATNPIYPDWWLAEATAEQLTAQHRQHLQQQQQQKPPRPQPRLAYSAPKQQQQDITADDLVTAEYLVVPGSGYGQHKQQLVPFEHDPPISVTHITPSTIATSPTGLQQQQYDGPRMPHEMDRHLPPPAVAAPSAHSSRAAPSSLHRHKAPGAVSRGLPSLSRVESKIKQALAASKQQAAAKQDHRQQLLSSVIATSSNGEEDQGQQNTAIRMEESCPPAATAEQFIANPWTSWFLPGCALDLAARSASMSVPAAAVGEEEAQLLQPDQQPSELAGYDGGDHDSDNLDCSAVADLVWPQAAAGEFAALDSAVENSMSPAATTTVAAAGSRGALCDITFNLNQQQSMGTGLSDDGSCKQHWQQPLAMEGSGSSIGSFAFTQAPVAAGHSHLQQPRTAEKAPGHYATASQQPERQQAWAADFGHLHSVQLDAALREAQHVSQPGGQRRQPHQRQQWSQKWVGNFGHLTGPRFCEDTAFSHHNETENQGTAAGSSRDDPAAAYDHAKGAPAAPGSSNFLLSSAGLDDLLAAGKAFTNRPAASAPDSVASPELAATANLTLDADEEGLESAGVTVLEHWQQVAAAAQARAKEIAVDVTAGVQHSAAPAAVGSDPLRLRGDVQETGSPTKHSGASAGKAACDEDSSNTVREDDSTGGEDSFVELAEGADSADEYLAGLQDTSRMLQQALHQHNSVMQLVGLLDSAQAQQARQGQQQGADMAGSIGAAAHTAAWVAASAAHKEHGD